MHLVPPMAVLFLAALCGCVSAHPRGPAEAVGTAGQREVQEVHYRLDEGFVPARLDVETGTRVVLVSESGALLTPGFAQRHGHAHTDRDAHSGGETDHHGAHGGPAGPGQPVWTPDDPEAGGDRWAHSFRVSGYWRYHNELNPKHSGLVVALPGSGGASAELEPLAMEGHPHTFVEPPRPTFHESMRLLQDQEFLREFMKAHGPANTLEVLRQAEVETGLDCHHGAHHLGRMAFAEYGPAVSASIADTCQSGMRHGVMEQLFVTRGTANLAADVASMCPPPARAFARYQCLHGVGHGVMAWTAYELEDALGLCELLGDEFSRTSCYAGVFMENVVSGLSGSGGQVSPYVDPDDPHYPCNMLAERYVRHCYWYQTSQMLRVFDHDLTRVAEACREAPPGARRSCFGSYGRDVAGAHRPRPHRVVLFCDEAPSSLFRGDCIDGAVRTLFWDRTQQANGLDLCAMVEEQVVAETCRESVVTQAHAVLPTTELEAFCGKLPERWRDRCRRRR